MPQKNLRKALQSELDDLLDSQGKGAEHEESSSKESEASESSESEERSSKAKSKEKSTKTKDTSEKTTSFKVPESIGNRNKLKQAIVEVKSRLQRQDEKPQHGYSIYRKNGPESKADLYCQIFTNQLPLKLISKPSLFIEPEIHIHNAEQKTNTFSYLSIILLHSTTQCRQQAFQLIQHVLLSTKEGSNPKIHKNLSPSSEYDKDTKLLQSVLNYFVRIKIYPAQIKDVLNPLIQEYLKITSDKQEIERINDLLQEADSLPSEPIKEAENITPDADKEDKQKNKEKKKRKASDASVSKPNKKRKTKDTAEELATDKTERNDDVPAQPAASSSSSTTTTTFSKAKKEPRYLDAYLKLQAAQQPSSIAVSKAKKEPRYLEQYQQREAATYQDEGVDMQLTTDEVVQDQEEIMEEVAQERRPDFQTETNFDQRNFMQEDLIGARNSSAVSNPSTPFQQSTLLASEFDLFNIDPALFIEPLPYDLIGEVSRFTSENTHTHSTHRY